MKLMSFFVNLFFMNFVRKPIETNIIFKKNQ